MTSFTLANGLQVFLLPGDSPFTAVALGYKVGAAHEKRDAIGVAHLLEHLLFEDDHIAYDTRIQAVGGSTNAYTGQDYTVYHAKVPRGKAPLVVELEAKRLFSLQIDPEKVAIQRQVVAEEFRQRYLNPPYADRFFYLSQAAFPNHPYQHMVIGETPEQILEMPYEAVRGFYEAYYAPRHAVLCIAGGGIDEDLSAQVQAHFSLPKSGQDLPSIPSVESLPPLDVLVVREGGVPTPAVLWAYRIPPLEHPDVPAIDILDDFLGDTRAGFLPQRLIKEKRVAVRLNTYVWQLHQGGLWVIEAYLPPTGSIEAFEKELDQALTEVPSLPLQEALETYRPQRYLSLHREREKALGQALALLHAVLAGHIEWYLDPLHPYEILKASDLEAAALHYLQPQRRIRLHYLPRRNGAIG